MAGPKPLIRATARAKGKRMRLPGWVRLPAWIRLPDRTVRVRLTALYGILFVMSGALLLAIASGVAVVRSSVSMAGPGPSPHPPAADAGPGSAVAAGRPAGSGTAVTRPADRLAVRAGRHDRGVGGAWVAGRRPRASPGARHDRGGAAHLRG